MSNAESVLTKEYLIEELLVKKRKKKELSIEHGFCERTVNKFLNLYNIEIKRVGSMFTDLTNKKFGQWKVIKQDETNKKTHHSRWLCKCSCGKEKVLYARNLVRNHTISCGCSRRKKMMSGCEDINSAYFTNFKKSALRRGYTFEITAEDVWYIYEQQNRKCAFSGLSVTFDKNTTHGKTITASIDRKNSNIGYIKDNIQIVHKCVNFLKRSMSDSELLFWSKLIYLNNKKDADLIKEINYVIAGTKLIQTCSIDPK